MENLIYCPLFENMSIEEILKVIGLQYGTRNYSPGDIILSQGDEYQYLMLLLEGEVSNSMTHVSGKNMFIETITAPGVLAPAIFYADNNKVPVDVTAVGRVKILPISKVEFNYMLQSNPKLLKNFLKMISNRSSFLSTKVRTLCFGTIKSKIAGYLLETSLDHNSNIFDIIHTQQELADMFGVTRPALAKTIKDMIDQGLISSKQKNFKIINKQELARIFRDSN